MVNRRLLRTRVFLCLYSFFLLNKNKGDSKFQDFNKKIKFSLDDLNQLYQFLFFIIISVFKYSDEYILKSKLKFNKSKNNDLFYDFSKNKLVGVLSVNILKKIDINNYREDKIKEIVIDIFNIFLKSNSLSDMCIDRQNTLEEDKNIVLKLFNDDFLKSQKLLSYIKNNNIYGDIGLTYVVRYINRIINEINDKNKKVKLRYASENDVLFTNKLIYTFGFYNKKYSDMIVSYATNWNIDRIALIDKILMKLALTEILEFDDIPYKVSINEYIDISKDFSTKKSHEFINGILDKIVHDFKISD